MWQNYVRCLIAGNAGMPSLPVRPRICGSCPTVYGRVHLQLAYALGTMAMPTRLQALRRMACILSPGVACRASYMIAAPHALDG